MSQSDLESMYKDVILEHHREPRNFGCTGQCDCAVEKFNPLCGDQVKIECKIDAVVGKLTEIHFEGQGCSISMASASILTEEFTGQTVAAALAGIERFRNQLQGKETVATEWGTDVDALQGVRNFPVRIKCALLAWTALKEALESYSGGKHE